MKRSHLMVGRAFFKCAAFLRPWIWIALIVGTISAFWTGKVPWWWGLACAAGIWLLTWVFARIGRTIFERSLTENDRQWLELDWRSRRGDAVAEQQLRELFHREFEQIKARGTAKGGDEPNDDGR